MHNTTRATSPPRDGALRQKVAAEGISLASKMQTEQSDARKIENNDQQIDGADMVQAVNGKIRDRLHPFRESYDTLAVARR